MPLRQKSMCQSAEPVDLRANAQCVKGLEKSVQMLIDLGD